MFSVTVKFAMIFRFVGSGLKLGVSDVFLFLLRQTEKMVLSVSVVIALSMFIELDLRGVEYSRGKLKFKARAFVVGL